MITKTSATMTNLKNLFIEIFLDKTNKVNNVADGSIVNATAFGVAKIGQKAMKDIAIKEAQIFPDTATGEYLDKAAALYGVSPRKGSLGSSTYIRVYADPGTVYTSSNFFVNQNGIRFTVDEALTVNSTGYGYVKVRSVNAGYVTNVPPNSIVTISPQPTGHIECTNEYYAIGGRDSEDDETFRIRIKNNLNILSKSTLEYYTQIFQKLDDRVLKVMNVGLDEQGIFNIYLVSQNGIFFTEAELDNLLLQAKDYFGLFELNLEGNLTGIVLKNVEWFYVGSERGIDFRLQLDPSFDVSTVRKSIQIGITKYLDFRFWTPGGIIQWDDLLDIVKKTEGVKYVPDEFFFPYYDQQVPPNQLPRVRGFVMRDEDGNILYDISSTLSPLFYPAASEDLFKGLNDNALSLFQSVFFTLVDDNGNPVSGARIAVGNNIILTDNVGQATIQLPNGQYTYVASKPKYDQVNGTFVVLNASVAVTDTLPLSPWEVTFKIVDEFFKPIPSTTITVGARTGVTNSDGELMLGLKNGSYTYSVTKLGYTDVVNKPFYVNNANITLNETMYLRAWKITVTVLSTVNSSPIPSATVIVGSNTYSTNSSGVATLNLVNGNYNLTVTKIGYNDFKTSLAVLNKDVAVTYNMIPVEYTITANVTRMDGTTPIPNANFVVTGTSISGVTNAQGQYIFKLSNGNYSYLVTKREFDDLSGGFNVNNIDQTLNLKMDLRHFQAAISVINEDGGVVAGALVNLNNQVYTTDSQGKITASLQNGTYSYTITRAGYVNYDGSITVADNNISQVATMIFIRYTALFVVKGKGNAPLQGAKLSIYGNNYTTDAQGQVSLTFRNGTFPYTITMAGYNNYNASLVVSNANVTENVTMTEKVFTVTFSVVGLAGSALEGATITVNSTTTTSDGGGIAIMSLTNGTYSYSCTKPGYVTSNGNFTVNNADTPVSVAMVPVSFLVTLHTVDDAATPAPLPNVSIQINGQTLTTNSSGDASITLYAGTYPVTYTLTNYLSVSASITVSKVETFYQTLKKIWKLGFKIQNQSGSPLEGVTVTTSGVAILNGPKTLVTKNDGTTNTIDVVNGPYSWNAKLAGYSPISGSGNISNANYTQNGNLFAGFSTTFVAKNGTTPVAGVSVVVDGNTTLTTDSNGSVSLNLSNGEHSYTYSKTGFMSGSGSITVNEASQTINIALVPGGVTTFTVKDKNIPMSGATVTINSATRATTIISTNSDGVASVDLANGTYNYTISQSGYKTKEATNFTVNGAPLSLAVDMTNYKYYVVTINTKLLTSNLSGVTVKLSQGSTVLQTLTTDASGNAVFSNYVNGSYTVEVSRSGYWTQQSSVNFDISGGNVSRNFVMQQVSTLTFTVKDSSSLEGIQNAVVTLTDLSSNKYTGTTNASGVATLKGTSPTTQPTTGVLYGSYSYTVVSPSPYPSSSGNITVNTATQNQNITVVGNFNVTFNVKSEQENSNAQQPYAGDLVYSDGTWSTIRDWTKTIVGLITNVRGREFDFMAKENITQSGFTTFAWNNGVNVPTIPTFPDLGTALADNNGRTNSQGMISTGNTAAAAVCAQYSTEGFPAGSWYIPSVNQLRGLFYTSPFMGEASIYINSVLGNIDFNLSDIWTSTQRSASEAWKANLDQLDTNSDVFTVQAKTITAKIRPFCTVSYNPLPDTVSIYDVNGKKYSLASWNALPSPKPDTIGVGVFTSKAQFVVMKTETSLAYDTSSTLSARQYIPSLPTTLNMANDDYFGLSNTYVTILQSWKNNASAVNWCRSQGSSMELASPTESYLPSKGEFVEMSKNLTAINECMAAIGGTPITNNGIYVSSTQYTNGENYIGISGNGSGASFYSKNLANRVRAFCSVPYFRNRTDGYYIQANDGTGTLYTLEEWNTLPNPKPSTIGIALLSPLASFVAAKEDIANQIWGNNTVSNILSSDDQTVIQYGSCDGKYETSRIVNQFSGQMPAAQSCYDYIFPNSTKGYLPTFLELAAAGELGGAITTGIWTAIGGSPLNEDFDYWSSGQGETSGMAWLMSGELVDKTTSHRIRPFGELITTTVVPLQGAIVTPDNTSSLAKTTDVNGQAVISLKAGQDHSYQVKAEGYSDATGQTGVISSNKSIDVTMQPISTLSILLTVNSISGSYAKNIFVQVSSLVPFGEIQLSGQTNDVGNVQFSLPNGNYVVICSDTSGKVQFNNIIPTQIAVRENTTMNIVGTGMYTLNFNLERVGVNKSGVRDIISTALTNPIQEGLSSAAQLIQKTGRILFKRTGDKEASFIRLGANDSNVYWNGEECKLDGSEGDVGVYLPNIGYKYASNSEIGAENLPGHGYRFSTQKNDTDWQLFPECIVGAYKTYLTGNKLYSRSGVTPSTNISQASFFAYAAARGTGYQIIDYQMHCQMAMLYMIKYGDRNSQEVLGAGGANPGTTGSTNFMGNNDTKAATTGWVNFQGIEGVFGGFYEFMQGIVCDNNIATISMNGQADRTLTVPTNSGWISREHLESGPYYDCIPSELSGSSSTYYCDYYSGSAGGTDRAALRSCSDNQQEGGIFYLALNQVKTSPNNSFSSRLAFRGTLTEVFDPTEFKAIVPV